MTQHRTYRQQRAAILGSRWVRTVSCYRITTAYLMIAALIVLLLFVS